MAKNKKRFEDLEIGLQTRELTIDKVDKKKREIHVSFSSDAKIRKYWGYEILDHTPSSVRLERLNTNSAPFLVNHDRGQHIGIVVKGWIDEAENKGRAIVRVGKSDYAEEIFQDVLDEIRTTISFSYHVHKAVLEEEDADGLDTYRATDWEPVEISLESVPADISVGVGRAADLKKTETNKQGFIQMKQKTKVADENNKPDVVNVDDIRSQLTAELNQRYAEITQIGEDFNMAEEAREAIQKNLSVDQFRQKAMEKLKTEKAIDTKKYTVDLTEKEARNYSILKMINAQLSGDHRGCGLEIEVSNELAKRMKQKPEGFYVPHDMLVRVGQVYGIFNQSRDITAGGTGSNLIGTDHQPQSFIELLRAKAVLTRLGAMILSGLTGDISIPKQTGAATAYWGTEGFTPTESTPTFGALNMSPKFVSAFVDYSRKMLLQGSPSVEGLVILDLLRVVTLAIDNQGIQGDGTGGTPTGIINTSGVGAVTGTSLGWSGVLEFETDVTEANGDGERLDWLCRPSVRGILKQRVKVAGHPEYLMQGREMNGYNVTASTQVPASHLIFGDFSQVILGLWGVLDIMVNKYTGADEGNTRIHAYQAADVGVRQAAAFSVSTNVD